jgi:hypothetical protein
MRRVTCFFFLLLWKDDEWMGGWVDGWMDGWHIDMHTVAYTLVLSNPSAGR